MKNIILTPVIFISLIVGNLINAQQWTQLGSDIDGLDYGEASGYSVSLSSDGYTVAIGAPSNSDIATQAGQVKVYAYDSGFWGQIGNDINGAAAYDKHGHSVSLNGDGSIVAIGAIGNDNNNGLNAGSVSIYKYDPASNAWSQLGNSIKGEGAGDNSGWSVSLSEGGDTVAIGAYSNDGGGTNAGHVRIYWYREAADTWVKVGNDIDGEHPGDLSGFSVSLSADGSIVAVGAHMNDDGGINAGHVRVYKYDNLNSIWSQQGNDIDGEAASDCSGQYISLSADGKVVAIGAPNNYGSGYSSGHVRVFRLVNKLGTFQWKKIGDDIDGEYHSDKSGPVSIANDPSYTVKNHGLIVAIGAPFNNGSATDAGHARVYQYTATGWIQKGTDLDGEGAGDNYGTSVCLNSDGSIVAVGGPYNDDFTSNAGHTRVFKNTSTKTECVELVTNQDPAIYPNPTNGTINIHVQDIKEVCILDITGKILSRHPDCPHILNLGYLNSGVYFIEIITEEDTITKKIIIN